MPGSVLQGDIAARRMPAFSWITPNLCNDTHDCGVSSGDAYLAGLVPGLLEALGPTVRCSLSGTSRAAGTTAAVAAAWRRAATCP